MSMSSVDHFFDLLTDEYTAVIERCFPRYREMLWALLEYLPEMPANASILELGCGTGNFSVLLREKFPQAPIRVVDVSSESLEACRKRFAGDERIQFDQCDFRDLAFSTEQFDLVVSSIAVHHLVASEKQSLFAKTLQWLSPGGVFSFADQFAGETESIRSKHLACWKNVSLAAGSTEQEWQMWMQHQAEHDHHDTLSDQMNWLAAAGFEQVDCTWRYLLWSVVQSTKPELAE